MRSLSDASNQLSLPLCVTKKRSKTARVHVLGKYKEVLCIELKVFWVLIHELEDTVEELDKNGRYLPFIAPPALTSSCTRTAFAFSLSMTATRVKRVTESHEVLFYECTEANLRAIERVEEKLSNSSYLRSAVPAMTTMKQNR
mmetsp:Transcript_24185/g.52658  ORF Transcript_24185/g.52658 Transcript_24185/m.52658 type:complete len:143 (-) Transcript_24185:755-1183(-)